jgi:hypothetical protein
MHTPGSKDHLVQLIKVIVVTRQEDKAVLHRKHEVEWIGFARHSNFGGNHHVMPCLPQQGDQRVVRDVIIQI